MNQLVGSDQVDGILANIKHANITVCHPFLFVVKAPATLNQGLFLAPGPTGGKGCANCSPSAYF
jgi:hypothetical protein